ncbi:Pectinacetylesterase family protein [Hibiscus syriacus]|uniref:Pectinacetylesterase family protein n=1 Tax=Hibiscus syriacus TaxID=106335 RepID=A0A6A3C1R5_HIBSY|nr:Pectinacetylesterase family protein [Hibiscus syriacus]
MASEESMAIVSSMLEDGFHEIVVVFDHDDDNHQAHPHNLSRLSMCTSSMSRLSIESFDADDDEDFFSKEESIQLSSDSDKEPGCYSLPATPLRWKNPTREAFAPQLMGMVTDYASENEDLKVGFERPKGSKNLRRRTVSERCPDIDLKNGSDKKDGDFMVGYSNYSGESEGGSAGVVVITRPKGSKRALCMDLEEVKACRDLGFELEHELILEIPSVTVGRVSLSGSTLYTASSGGDSPIANWRISSPGDDPRDVKAWLKMWAKQWRLHHHPGIAVDIEATLNYHYWFTVLFPHGNPYVWYIWYFSSPCCCLENKFSRGLFHLFPIHV